MDLEEELGLYYWPESNRPMLIRKIGDWTVKIWCDEVQICDKDMKLVDNAYRSYLKDDLTEWIEHALRGLL